MSKIEDNVYIIETEEKAKFISDLLNAPPKVNETLQKALNDYHNFANSKIKEFNLFE